jgi:hypothetical protein
MNWTLTALLVLLSGPAKARTWTDVKGRKIEAEYVSQSKTSVVLRLKNGREVAIPFKTLSPDDLSHLLDLAMKETKANGSSKKKETDPIPAGKEDQKPAADPAWDRPVLKKVTLSEPLKVTEEKKDEGMTYSSKNFRIVADGRITDKAVTAVLESAELAKQYCESLPFGLGPKFQPVDGKFEIHTCGKEDDWLKAGGQPGRPCFLDQESGKIKLCFEALRLNSSGRGGSDALEGLASQMILNVTRSMIPEIYARNLKDWFNEGFPNLMTCAVYEKGALDFTEIISETKDFLSGKSRSGQKAIFPKKEIEMMTMDDLLGLTMAGPADEEERREFLGQCILLVAYLMFLDDDGKATGLRQGLRFASDFQKSLPKSISYTSQEDLEKKRAELRERIRKMGDDALKKVIRDRPLEEVEKDMAARWQVHGLKLNFEKKEGGQ